MQANILPRLRARTNFVLIFIVWLKVSLAQNLPANPCPNNFEYLFDGQQYVGRLTIPIGQGKSVVQIDMSQRMPTGYNYGSLSLFYDQKQTLNNIRMGIPISYLIEFPNARVPSKLVKVDVNGRTICEGQRYPPPRTNIQLKHTLDATISGSGPIEPANPWLTSTITVRPTPIRPRIRPPPRIEVPTPATMIARPRPPPSYTCGQQFSTGVGLISGGRIVSPGEFPWLVAIFKADRDREKFKCGATLVSIKTVISAYHCFSLSAMNERNSIFHIGQYDMINSDGDYQSRKAKSIIHHPNYNHVNFPDADISIILLAQSVEITPYIQPICLWGPQENQQVHDLTGMKGIIVGWGSDNDKKAVTEVAYMLEQSIVSNDECRQSNPAFYSLVTDRTFCAGNRNGDGPCHGDSGGGLFIPIGNRWVLRGIISTGIAKETACDLEKFVVYTDLAKHSEWVTSQIRLLETAI